MSNPLRLVTVALVFILSTLAWFALGGVTSSRTHGSRDTLGAQVEGLWGGPLEQHAPTVERLVPSTRKEVREVREAGGTRTVEVEVPHVDEIASPLASSDVTARLHLDRRRKGLVWYALYDVEFTGTFTYVHREATPGRVRVRLPLPSPDALYDDFRFTVDGAPQRARAGSAETELEVVPGQRVAIAAHYRSRGKDRFAYVPAVGAEQLSDFRLRVQTDFADVNFADDSVSPTSRRAAGRGEAFEWRFRDVLTGRRMTLEMPRVLQPGELASELSFSAPISLFFFFLVLEALARRAAVALHPLHFAFLAGAFFAFHLVFAYTADRLTLPLAFGAASLTSVFLLTSYLRTLVSARFAYAEAGVAQLVYLVGFALAHFAEGFTGLTVTCLAVLTLHLLMQWTAQAERRSRDAGSEPGTLPAA